MKTHQGGQSSIAIGNHASDTAIANKLLEAAKQGDQEAFNEFVRRYQYKLFRQAQAVLGDPHLAADAVQNASLKLWQHRLRFDASRNGLGWALTIATRESINLLRQRERQRRIHVALVHYLHGGPVNTSGPSVADAGTISEHERRATALRRAVNLLPPDLRVVVEQFYYRKQAMKTIAKELGIPARLVGGRLFRARDRLRRLLGQATPTRRRAA